MSVSAEPAAELLYYREERTPPRCEAAAANLLPLPSVSPHDKVRQFVADQQRELGHADPTHDTPPFPQTPDEETLPTRTERTRPLKASGRKRKARADPIHNAGDDALALFRRSQKALRREAPNLNMRDVLCRSLSGVTEAPSESSRPFSPTAASSSNWSPSVATSITHQFLSNVRQRRRQTFERLMQRDGTHSQMSASRRTNDTASDASEAVLVICDETAMMAPPRPDAEAEREENTREEIRPVDPTPPPEACAAAELAATSALRRKHEVWRLRQKHLREKMQDEAHGNAKGGAPGVARAVEVEASFDVVMMAQRSITQRTQSVTMGLSADHIDMIRRVNSFENTSTQRVVVFETQSSKHASSKLNSV